MRLLIFLFVLASFLVGSKIEGQASLQDTAYWEAYDDGMVDRIWNGLEEPTYRKLFDSLKVEMAARLQNGPVTESLAYRYHWMSLRLKGFFLAEVKPYADTAIMLRTEVKAPTADIAQSYYEKGRVLRRIGNFQEALNFFEEGVRIMSIAIAELDSTPDLAKRQAYFLNETAWTAGLNGNFELARLRLRQIDPLLRLDTSSIAVETAYESIVKRANIEGLAGNLRESIAYYQAAKQTDYYRLSGPALKGIATNNLGLKYLMAGEFAAAERELLEALRYTEPSKDVLRLSNIYINLMHLRVKQERPQEALELMSIAEPMALEANGTQRGISFAELYLFAAEAADQLGDIATCEGFFEKAANALVTNPKLYGPAKLPVIRGNGIFVQSSLLQFLTTKRALFLADYRKNNQLDDLLLAHTTSYSIDTLLRLNREQLNLTSSLGEFITKEAEQYTTAVSIALEAFRKTGEITYLEKAYEFVANQKSNLLRRYLTSPSLASALGVPDTIIDKKKALELKVLIVEKAMATGTGEEEMNLRDSLLRLNYSVVELKEEIATSYPEFSRALRGVEPIDPESAAQSLADDQLVVEYFLSADSIYTFTLSKAEGVSVVVVSKPDNLTELIASVIEQGPGAQELYALLVEPILDNRPKITRLQFIPDGDLWKIPFAALKRGDDFLIADYAVSFAYAAPLLFNKELATQARAQEQEYLGYGISYENLQQNLSGGGLRSADLRDLRQMGRLPFASREVQKAAEVIGGPCRLDQEASLTRFLRESAGANILHLSMHGLLRPNPMESALVFAGDGEEEYALLEMKDVLGGYYPAELTVLSACHTGGGTMLTSEGMQSIGRAFTAAGSRATITSTWAARDESTHDILGLFFTELKAGAPKDIALQKAINTYLANGTIAERNPSYWANLTLTGETAGIDRKTNTGLISLLLVALPVLGILLFYKQQTA